MDLKQKKRRYLILKNHMTISVNSRITNNNQRENYPSPATLDEAILYTLIYADIFDYPVTLSEIHKYLIRYSASIEEIEDAINTELIPADKTSQISDYYFLPGREQLVDLRRKRNALANKLWRKANRYGKWMSIIPFVRMVAVTGSLASNNVKGDGDIDYFIVTEPGFLWLSRAMILGLRRLTSPFGRVICPNYLISLNALKLEDQDLYTAQELTRMVLIFGREYYNEFRKLNNWTTDFLPNASSSQLESKVEKQKIFQEAGEFLLNSNIGRRLGKWEMNRKIQKLELLSEKKNEVYFGADCCKGHFDGHAYQTISIFSERLNTLTQSLTE